MERGVLTKPILTIVAWIKDVKLLIRRSAMVGPLRGAAWLQMRKLGAVLRRGALRADFEGELFKRTWLAVPKSSLTGVYREQFEALSDKVGEWQAGRVSRRSDHRTLDEEWRVRSAAAPSGSSSLSAVVKATGRLGGVARPSDRPNKKAALSCVTDLWMEEALRATPVNIARASTKPEPDDKARALLAQGDTGVFIATHGIRGFEGSANWGGMAASQRPEVIGQWLVGCSVARRGVLWSADLDDYNWQHEMWELSLMWESRARGFEKQCGRAAVDRAASCRWVASSFAANVIMVDGKPARAFLGLYSGHRGTTEDNTAKHELDRLLTLDELEKLGMRCTHNDPSESGDDESNWTETWLEGAAYLQLHRMRGHRMNAAKQLAGSHHGEYLQRCVSEDVHPQQPLASILATLVTGNWYRPSGTWLNAALTSCCDNWLEAHARGLPRSAAARMCGMILDQIMVTYNEDAPPTPLEWRRYARSNDAGNALFGACPGYGKMVPPDLVVRQQPDPRWFSPGVSDYMETPHARWLVRAMPKKWLVDQWRDAVAVDAHGSGIQVAERERVNRMVAKRWPPGHEFTEIPRALPPIMQAPGLTQTVDAWVRSTIAGRSVSEEDNLAAMGVGQKEASLLGGYQGVLTAAPPERLARVKPLRAGPCRRTRVAADQLILAGLSVHALEHPEFGLAMPATPEKRRMTVVAAAHGAGISRLARRFNQKECMRYDRLASAWVGQSAYKRPWDGGDYEDHHRSIAELVALRIACGYPGLKVLLTHEHPDMICAALGTAGIESTWVRFSPDEVERARRVAGRNVAHGLFRYMEGVKTRLLGLQTYSRIIEEEQEVVQLIASHA
jgi:hypothetical protein